MSLDTSKSWEETWYVWNLPYLRSHIYVGSRKESNNLNICILLLFFFYLGFLHTLFKVLAITFSCMAVFAGTPLYGPSLHYAGPASLVWGWVAVSFFTWFVGLALAEICSSFPVWVFFFFFFFFFVTILFPPDYS